MHNALILMYLHQWPRCLRRGSAAVRLLGLRVRIPPESWLSVCCECCVLSGRCLCVRLITYPGGVLRSVVCLSAIMKPWRLGGPGPLRAVVQKEKFIVYIHTYINKKVIKFIVYFSYENTL